MSTTLYLHGPHNFTVHLVAGANCFAALDTGDASLFLYTRADCDALVKAALAARDLLPEDSPPEPRSYEQARTDMATMTDAEWEASDKLPLYTEPPGVAHCAPGDCTCGGHVDADGVFHAAGAR